MLRLLYTVLLFLLLPLVPLRLLWRSLRQPEYLHHCGERFGFFGPVADQPVIWLHCVSVGETRASAPLVELLRQRYPGHAILLTHTTPTGRAASEQLFGDTVLRAYLPYDLPFAVGRFLKHFRPQVGLLMETELWFNLIHACKARGIPLLLVNARMSAKSARGYARLGWLVENALEQLTAVAAQTREDAERLCELGAPQAVVTGNLKFDVMPSEDAMQQAGALRKLCGEGRPVFLAASTREGEEALVLDAVAQAAVPGLLTVIVPRHPQRFDEVAALLEKRGLPYVRRSSLQSGFHGSSIQSRLPAKREREGDEEAPQTVQPVRQGADEDADKVIVKQEISIILGDSMGEMPAYYAACDLAFIGGSLLPYGGQNLIEACALGKPVLIGPHTFNFEEAASQAVLQGAAARVWDASSLASELRELMADAAACKRMGEAGLAFAAANRGAAQRTLALVEKLI